MSISEYCIHHNLRRHFSSIELLVFPNGWLNKGLDVLFEYDPEVAQTWDEPGIPAQVTIHHVLLDGMDIIDLLKDEVIQELTDEILGDDDE